MVRVIRTQALIPAPFKDEVHDMADFIKDHPECLGDEVKIITRELGHGVDGRRLDFLVYDIESNQPGLVELKKDFADEKVLLQTLRYADWFRNNPDTIRYQISRKKLDIDTDDMEGLKIYIVAPRIMSVVAELAQYIQGFEFEFIQLERFKDSDGKFIAVTSPLEVPNRTTSRASERLEHDRESYSARGFSQDRLDLLDKAVDELASICEEKGWQLAPRRLKNAVKFQTGGGRNVFMVRIRKRDDHGIRFCLGSDFDISSVSISNAIKSAIRHKSSSRWWEVPLQTEPISKYRSLLTAAYTWVAEGF